MRGIVAFVSAMSSQNVATGQSSIELRSRRVAVLYLCRSFLLLKFLRGQEDILKPQSCVVRTSNSGPESDAKTEGRHAASSCTI